VAVLPVVLFHAGFAPFDGGYIGVDVFFVISGYLITTLIVQEQRRATFTIVSFYERRARRILPALFLVMAACLPPAWAWMTPHHLKRFAQSLVAASVFAPNVYFLIKSGYFEIDADELPLLHTWSLGVEEQYYIVFPVFVLLCWRFGLRTLAMLVALTAVLSLCLSEWASHAHPEGNFFLPTTRAWELAIGALVAMGTVDGPPRARWRASTHNALALLGLAAILIPVVTYDRTTRFPGLSALAPTLGTALVIAFGRGSTLVGRVLSTKWIVGTGLISYSFYLWHQPLFAFARLHSLQRPSALWMCTLILVSFALAYLTWRFVEEPVRDRRRYSRRQIFAAAAAMSGVVIGLGLAGQFSDGFPGRLSADQQRMMAVADDEAAHHVGYPPPDCFLASEMDATRLGKCTDSPTRALGSILLWGDSHAAHLYSGLQARVGQQWTLTTLTAASCPPLPDTGSLACRSVYDEVLARIRRAPPERVVLAAVWGHYDWRGLVGTLQALREAGVTQVDVIGPVPRWNPSLPVVLLRYNVDFDALPMYSKIGLDPSVGELDTQLAALATEHGANYISALNILCTADGCRVRLGSEPSTMMQWDVSHLTAAGSMYLVAGFRGPGW
jgi:peptidoglycan/LPS O-acetylase OafA/YrhL